MSYQIKKVGVLGAGVMGSQIAAILAGSGCDVLLLDLQPPKESLVKLTTQKPSPLYRVSDLQKIQLGSFAHDLRHLSGCDWVIEAVVEKLQVKRELYQQLEQFISSKTIVTSNTSGLSLKVLLEGLSPSLRERFFVTHFFNPPRYLKLLEVVTHAETDSKALGEITSFCEERLGKGVVFAKDTPNFIANRIGVFHFFDVIHLTEESSWPLEAVDQVMGPATARPKSAIFRTADLVGLDTLSLVAETVFKGCAHDPDVSRLRIPQFMQKMITNGWLGQKSGQGLPSGGQGFYMKDRATDQIRVIDPATLEYRPKVTMKTPSLGAARTIRSPHERLRRVVFADDQAGEIAWPCLSRTLVYAAKRIPEIADDIVQIDRALRWGFGWELGPFEMWDALGVSKVASRLEMDRVELPPLVRDLLQSGAESFYGIRDRQRLFFDLTSKTHLPETGREQLLILSEEKNETNVVEKNASASLIDLGDGIFCCEFHTKMNAIDPDLISFLISSVARVEKEGVGLLIANQGEHFSAGANLLMILMAAQQKRWEEIEKMIRGFQAMAQCIRFSLKPVMAAPFGMTLGGGCEIALAASRRHAAVETYVGLVEVGAGVVPAGGGCKNFLLHFEAAAKRAHRTQDRIWFSADDGGPFPKVSKAFELIGTGKVSTSALEAKDLGIFLPDDGISMDREKLLFEAKMHLLQWAPSYNPPSERDDIMLPGRGGKMALLNALEGWRKLGIATDYDCVIAEKLAHILAGGDRPCSYRANEQHLLDLEREAFLSLCGNEKTQERMAHLLKTGKPLRN